MNDNVRHDPVWREEASPELLAKRLARAVSRRLSEAIDERGSALLAVSGGKTPLAFFNELSGEEIAWDKVTVILADERFVPPVSSRSNERLVTLGLLQNNAAKAHFEGLYERGDTVEEAARTADAHMRDLAFPPDVTVLGMGQDGHVASLFGDWPAIETGLDTKTEAFVLAVRSERAGEPRLTLPLARIVESGFIALLIEGYTKKEILMTALDKSDGNLPVTSVIRNASSPVHIFWAPRDPQASEAEQ